MTGATTDNLRVVKLNKGKVISVSGDFPTVAQGARHAFRSMKQLRGIDTIQIKNSEDKVLVAWYIDSRGDWRCGRCTVPLDELRWK